MKKMIFTLVSLLMLAVQTNAMSYEQARNEALFLTDKMAYELNLSDAQYEAAYEINLDYLMSVTGYGDVNGICWERRNADLRYILYSWQWDAFCAASYFFRPLYWDAGYWHFGIYARYPRRDYFYFGRPHFYASYRGGHSWRMNGDRSFYEHRRDMFRPGHVSRDNHVGMRNGWDRGDYRGAPHGSSSTRVTGGRNQGNHDSGWRSNGGSRDTHGTHSGSTHSGGTHNGGTHNGGTHSGGTYNGGTHSGGTGGYHGSNNGGSRNSGNTGGGYSGGGSRNSGNTGGGYSGGGGRNSGSTGGGYSGGGSRNSGSTGGGSHSSGSRSGSNTRGSSGHFGGSSRR